MAVGSSWHRAVPAPAEENKTAMTIAAKATAQQPQQAAKEAEWPPISDLLPLAESTSSSSNGPGSGQMEEDRPEAAEESTAKGLSVPIRPTPQMIENHRAGGHVPFRSWCPACVRGRGRSFQHHLTENSEEQVPTISIDYGFFGSQEATSTDSPVIVAKDRKSKRIWAYPVPAKGVHPYALKCLVEALNQSGYKKVILKSDQENPITALARRAKEEWQGEIILENSPKGESKSNGEIERAVQEVQGIARSLREDLVVYGKLKIEDNSPLLTWLIRHAGHTYTLFHKGEPADGMTPYQRSKGKEWKIALPPFGEIVEYRIRTSNKLHPRWAEGIFLGVNLTSSEKLVGTKEGIFVVQSIRRVPEDRRHSQEAIDAMQSLPWKPRPGDDNVSEEPTETTPIILRPEVPEAPTEPP